MSQRLTNSFINTNIPGAYPNVTVKSNPVGVSSSGIIAIIGEADGGDNFKNVALKDNSFTPDQLDLVSQIYQSGQIVDAFRALPAPSNDADITGSANRIFIVKTNNSLKASALVDTDYGTLSDKNFGANGNKYKYQIAETAIEAAPSISGAAVPAFGAALNGASFSIRVQGSVASVVTLSNTAGDHDTIAHLVTELEALVPMTVSVSQGDITNSLKISMPVDASANRKGYGKSFELIDSTSGDLASLGLPVALEVSSQEPEIEVSIVRSDIGLSETLDIVSSLGLQIGYNGTTASMTINKTAKTLTTTVVGGTGANLAIDLTTFQTLADLVSYIVAQTGYSAAVPASSQQLNPSALDAVSALGIAASAGVMPGRVKISAFSFQQIMATSTALAFAPASTGQSGLPSAMANPAFLSGGSRGATLAADIVDAVDQLAGVQVNIIVPLFSQDASADITAGQTSSESTYTIDAINASVKNHCIQYSTPKLKRNRIAILSSNDTYAKSKQRAQQLANYRCSLVMQKVTQENSVGVITIFQPWYLAAVAAGMQTGGFYKAIVNKLANVISFTDPVGFDSGSPGDVEDALDAGLLFIQALTAGNSWVSDQTTYGQDANFVYNSLQAVYASDLVALDLAASFQSAFVGKSLADVTAAVGLSFLAQKMDQYRKQKLIAASDDAPLGYKNAKIKISAPVMDVSVEIKLATAIYFIPISINISQVQQSAG